MNSTPQLLPPGFRDQLPPEAERSSRFVSRLMKHFFRFGYAQVTPPLLEYEGTLFSGVSSGLRQQSFRFMDPQTNQMLGLRADMTGQVARIAASRYTQMNRVQRLCYTGQVMRLKGEGVNQDRQLAQMGLELAGTDAIAADVEIIRLLAMGLQKLKVEDISIDFQLPELTRSLIQNSGLNDDNQATLANSIEQKDIATIARLAPRGKSIIEALITNAGEAQSVLTQCEQLSLENTALASLANLRQVVETITKILPNVTLTIDPLEQRGFDYHTGISFALFAKGAKTELARGGRYTIPANTSNNAAPIPATGATLTLAALLQAAPTGTPRKRILVESTLDEAMLQELQEDEWQTVASLLDGEPGEDEARQMDCKALFDGGRIITFS